MKKVIFLLLLTFGIQTALVYSADVAPTYNKTVIEQLGVDPSLLAHIPATELEKLIVNLKHIYNIGINTKDTVHTIALHNKLQRYGLGNTITAYVQDSLMTKSYTKLFDFLEAHPQYADHIAKLHKSWISFGLHCKHLFIILSVGSWALLPLLKLTITEKYITSMSDTPHGQNIIRKSIAALLAMFFAQQIYVYYKKASVINNTYHILEALKANDTQFAALKQTYTAA